MLDQLHGQGQGPVPHMVPTLATQPVMIWVATYGVDPSADRAAPNMVLHKELCGSSGIELHTVPAPASPGPILHVASMAAAALVHMLRKASTLAGLALHCTQNLPQPILDLHGICGWNRLARAGSALQAVPIVTGLRSALRAPSQTVLHVVPIPAIPGSVLHVTGVPNELEQAPDLVF